MRTEVNVAADGPVEERQPTMSPLGVEGLLVRDAGGATMHAVPPPIVGALRYAVARMDLQGKIGVPKILGVTAAHSGEGVSFVSRSLATVLAHDREATVCIVDLNWWSAARGPDVGAASVVEGGATVSEALVATQNPRLRILPAGALPLERRSIVARAQELSRLLADLALQFDHLVVDLPPLLLTSEALTLAARCDTCLLVIRHGVTASSDVKAALELLGTVDVLGVVLNRISSRIPAALLRRLPR